MVLTYQLYSTALGRTQRGGGFCESASALDALLAGGRAPVWCGPGAAVNRIQKGLGRTSERPESRKDGRGFVRRQQEECPQESQPWAFSSRPPATGARRLEPPTHSGVCSAPRPDTDAVTPVPPPTPSGPEWTSPIGPVFVSLSLNTAAGLL